MADELDYLPLKRSFFKHKFWSKTRQFSYAEAWLWLISEASFCDRTQIINAKRITVRRGQLVASSRFLQQAWGWSNTKVENFLEILVQENMVEKATHENDSKITVLSLVNYGFHNNFSEKNDTQKRQKNDSETTVKRQLNDKTNNIESIIVLDTDSVLPVIKDLNPINTGQKNFAHVGEKNDNGEPVPVPPTEPKKKKENISPAQKKEKSHQARVEAGDIPGSLADVEAYFLTQHHGWKPDQVRAQAEQFWNHYEANGWLQTNRKPIVKWKAAVGGWISRHNSGQFGGVGGNGKGYSLQSQVAVKSDGILRAEIEAMYQQYRTGDKKIPGFHGQHYEYLKSQGHTKNFFPKEVTAQIEQEAIKRRVEFLNSGTPTLSEQHLAQAYQKGDMSSELVKADEGRLTYIKRKLAMVYLFSDKLQKGNEKFFV